MREINKLVGLVTTRLKSHYNVIDLNGNDSDPGKEQLLYNGVLSGQYLEDEPAAQGMYSSDIYDQRFRMLKSRLRHKLYDLIYHIDFDDPKYSYASQARLECLEYIHKAEVLLLLEEYAMVEKQINKALAIAEVSQFTDILVKAKELQRDIYAKLCQPTDYQLAIDALTSLRALHHAEQQALDIWTNIQMLLNKSIHSRSISVETTAEAVLELKSLSEQFSSFVIFEKHYKLKAMHDLLENNFEGLIQTIETANKDFVKLNVDEQLLDTSYNNYLVSKAHLHLGQFEEGSKVVKSALKTIDKSLDIWFDIHELSFLMAMHSQSYKKAEELLAAVLKNPNFKRASDRIVNRWKIFRLYLNFASMNATRLKRVRFNEMYSVSHYYYTELKGYYISLPLLEFMHLVDKDRIDEAITKLDDVETYFYKHLNDPGKNQREKQLFKLLKLLKSNDFDIELTKENGALYLQKMSDKKLNEAFSDFEIIPLEHLWNAVLKMVEKAKMSPVTY